MVLDPSPQLAQLESNAIDGGTSFQGEYSDFRGADVATASTVAAPPAAQETDFVALARAPVGANQPLPNRPGLIASVVARFGSGHSTCNLSSVHIAAEAVGLAPSGVAEFTDGQFKSAPNISRSWLATQRLSSRKLSLAPKPPH